MSSKCTLCPQRCGINRKVNKQEYNEIEDYIYEIGVKMAICKTSQKKSKNIMCLYGIIK